LRHRNPHAHSSALDYSCGDYHEALEQWCSSLTLQF
jgi:hypothetical protein